MLHEPEYHILYNMYLELSMSTALNYYAAEFNRFWSKIINLYTLGDSGDFLTSRYQGIVKATVSYRLHHTDLFQ